MLFRLPHFIRWPLSAALAAAAVAAVADDSTPGKINIEADSLSQGNTARAVGNVRACFGDYVLQTEILEYDRDSDVLFAPSSFELQAGGRILRGGSLRYSPRAQSGEAADFDIVVGDDGLHAAGEKLIFQNQNFSAKNADISSCKPESRDWSLRVGDLRQEGDVVSARHLWFRAGEVPVMYLPTMRLHTSDEKRSGFLRPLGEYSSGDGFNFGLPYYFFWKDNADFTLTPQWFSEHGLLLDGEARYVLPNQKGQAEISWTPLEGKGRGRQSFSHAWSGGRWRLAAAAENVSDDNYFSDFSDNSDQLALRNLSRRAAAEYRGDNWRWSVAMESFKTINYSGPPPHDLLPQTRLRYDDSGGDYQWSGEWEYSRFVANQKQPHEGDRWRWNGFLRRRLLLGGWEAHPEAGLHAVKYPGGAAFMTPYGRTRLESAHYPLPALGGSYQLRATYAYARQSRQNNAPLFDTALREFSSGGIYDWNRFSGGDRAADANVAAYGAHFRRRDEADGRELWTLEFAQRYYFRRPRIVLPGESSPPERGFANLFAELKARPDKRWKLEGNAEWNPADKSFESVYADARADFGGRRLLRVGGLFEKDKSLVLGGALPLGKRADGAALAHYLLGKDKITESSAALEIRGECGCWLLHLKINNVLTSERRRKQSYSVGLTLRGLGSAGGRGYQSIADDLR